VAEFEAELARRTPGFPNAQISSEQRDRVLEEMIGLKAALAKARAKGQDREPQTRKLIDQLIASQFLEAEFARRTLTNSPVSDTEITAYYETHPQEFRVPASVRAGVVFLKVSSKASPEKLAEMRGRAEELRAQAVTTDEAGFARLVQQHSDDQSSRYTGGDTGWLRAGESSGHWPGAVVEAALALAKIGDVAGLVETTNGFFVVRLTERRAAAVRPLADVREAVRFQLQQNRQRQQQEEFAAELKRGLNIQINEAVLNTITAAKAGPTSAPPSLPGG
jgi:parvulin-like peptidyl-prolyl isomerase